MEIISRHGKFKADATRGPNAEHEFHPTDGKGRLPLQNQPDTMSVPMAGIIQANQGVTLWFRRGHGSTDAYVWYNAFLDAPPETKPATRAQ